MSLRLWEQVAAWKSPKYRFVDLTHELSPETPHWWGFKPLKETTLYDYPENKKDGDTWTEAPMQIKEYTVVGQYGTHVDAPIILIRRGVRKSSFVLMKWYIHWLLSINPKK